MIDILLIINNNTILYQILYFRKDESNSFTRRA